MYKYFLIRDLIKQYMKQNSLTQKELAQQTAEITESHLCFALSGSRKFTLKQIDAITKALGLPFAFLYKHFSSECYNEKGGLLKLKSGEFIVRCYEHDREQFCQSIIDDMIEKGAAFLDVFYAIGEELRKEKLFDKAIYFYDLIDELAIDRTSPILSFAIYRKFSIVRSVDSELEFEYAVKLSNHLFNLPDQEPITILEAANKSFVTTANLNFRFEAYRKVIASFYALEKWKNVYKYCDELIRCAKEIDEVYFGIGLIYKSKAAYHNNDYELALQLIEQYSQIDENHEYQFRKLGTANKYNVMLEIGHLEILHEHIAWLEDNRDEVAGCSHIILETCLNFGLYRELEQFLAIFQNELAAHTTQVSDPWKKRLAIRHFLAMARYELYLGRVDEAVEKLLVVAYGAIEAKLVKYLLKVIDLFYTHQEKMNTKQRNIVGVLLSEAILTL